MSEKQLLREGQILTGSLFSEPMRVEAVRANGPDTWVAGLVGTQSERFRKVTLTTRDIENLTILDTRHSYDGDGRLLRLGLQAYSLGIAYEYDPYFGLSISRVDPLPHQLEAVYDHLLKLARVRFLLADDAGAGKTIMAGLLIRELELRGLAERILIVCPANLSFQWQRELKEKFDEKFLVLKGGDIRDQFGVNQWLEQKRVITSLDLAKRQEILPGLRQVRWDLVIVDEAHRMSAADETHKSLRYKLGELLRDTSDHLLLLTATPHKGDPLNFSLFEGARQQLDRVGMMFWRLTRFVLDGRAKFGEANLGFDLETPSREGISPGHYRLISKEHENVPGKFLYRFSHPLGEYVIEAGKNLPTPAAHIRFDISGRPTRIALVQAQKSRYGCLHLQRLTIDSFEREEHLLFSGVDDDGRSLDQETLEKMFHCEAKAEPLASVPSDVESRLAAEAERHTQATISRSLETNNRHFQEAREKLEKWADDMVIAAEKELKDTKERIKALTRQARLATTIEEQHALQKQIQELEKQKRRQRQRIFDVEDEIMAKRDELIERLEKRMRQRTNVEPLFTIRWSVV